MPVPIITVPKVIALSTRAMVENMPVIPEVLTRLSKSSWPVVNKVSPHNKAKDVVMPVEKPLTPSHSVMPIVRKLHRYLFVTTGLL